MLLKIQENVKILVVSPHPDDESIGCGGLLAKYPKQCDVLLITDGNGQVSAGESVAETREAEFITAMEYAGVNKYTCLRIPEGDIPSHRKVIAQYDFGLYDYIFVPNRHEIHKDHIAVYKTVKSIARKKAPKAILFEYEVWTTIRNPNVFLDISDVHEKKEHMIEIHKSQINDLDYVGMIMGLNAYRGRSRHFDYVESFFSGQKLKEHKIKQTKKKIKKIIKK